MKDDDFKKGLRQRLDRYEEPVPEDLWPSIASELNAAARRRARVVVLRRWMAAAAVAALLLGGAALLWRDGDTPQPQKNLAKNPILHTNDATQAVENDQQQDASPLLAKVETKNVDIPAISSEVGDVPAIGSEVADDSDDSRKDEKTIKTDDKKPLISPDDQATEAVEHHPTRQPEKNHDFDRRKPETRQKPSLSLYAANGFNRSDNNNPVVMSHQMVEAFQSTNATVGAKAMAPVYLTHYSEHHRHHPPVSIGLSVAYPLTRRLSLASGLVYTRLRSESTFFTPTQQTHREQTLHYVGVPLQLHYQLLQYRNFSTYASAGAQADFNVHTSTKTNATAQQTQKDRLQWSLSAALGLQYQLSNHAALYSEIGLRHYLDNHSSIENAFKQKTSAPTLQFGLRFNP